MRILHTSDWHLGISTGPASRNQEQAWFLDWLLETLEDRKIDALIVAGDVFDTLHPSSDAQALYYRFLARVADTGTRDVVIVGGNHDSPARLDAPRALLETVGVHVIGGLPPVEQRNERLVAPLRARGSDQVAAVCLAVPYVHEYRLGIRATGLDPETSRAAFRTEFSKLYTGLTDHAIATYPGVPIVATGHLTLGGGSTRDDYPQEIHQVGIIEGLPVDILDKRICYGALGHIHRCYPVAGSQAWYCGTPMPYSLPEMKADSRVLVVDLEPEVRVEEVTVPRRRDLLQFRGPPDEVIEALGELEWTTSLPPLIRLKIETQLAEPGLVNQLHAAMPDLGDQGRPVLVEVQQRATTIESDPKTPVIPALELLQPGEVFELMCDAKQLTGEARDQLRAAFDRVAGTTGAVFETLLEDIELPEGSQ